MHPSPFLSGPPICHLHANWGRWWCTPPVSAHGPPLPAWAACHPGPALHNPHHSLSLLSPRKEGMHTLPVHTRAEPGFCNPSSHAPPCGRQGTHEKKGGRGYAGKPRGCASKGRGRMLTNRMGACTRQGRVAMGQNTICAPPYFVPPVHMPVCAQRRGGTNGNPGEGWAEIGGHSVPPVPCTHGKGGNARGRTQGGGRTNWRGHARGRGAATSGRWTSFTKGEGGRGRGEQKRGEDKGGRSKGGAGRGCCLSLLPKWGRVIYVLFSFVFIGALEINYERQK